MINCATATPPPDPMPAHETINIDSKILGEIRVINVWKPSTYQNSNKPLPVLYMPDGGEKEDFPQKRRLANFGKSTNLML